MLLCILLLLYWYAPFILIITLHYFYASFMLFILPLSYCCFFTTTYAALILLLNYFHTTILRQPYCYYEKSDENMKYCACNRIRTHTFCHSWASMLTITLQRLPDAITVSIPTCLYGFMSERSVHTTTLLYSYYFHTTSIMPRRKTTKHTMFIYHIYTGKPH